MGEVKAFRGLRNIFGKPDLDPVTDFPKMDVNPVTLAFKGELEKKFQADYYNGSIGLLRLSFLLGIFYYSIFTILDAMALPEVRTELSIVRFLFVCPAILATFILSFTKSFHKWWQLAASITTAIAGLGIVIMTIITPELGRNNYYPGIILILFYCYMLIKLRFVWATGTGWLIFVAYILSIILFPGMDPRIVAINIFFLSSGNILGMFGGYTLEYYTRKDFFFRYLLKRESEKVERANSELEEKVREKTQKLQQDIHRREQLEQKLKEREMHLRSIIQNPEGYMIYRLKAGPDSMSPTVTHVSPSITDLIGVSPEESRNYTKWFANVHPEDLSRLIEANQRGMTPPFVFAEEFRYNHPTKGTIWLQAHTNGIPYADDPGNIEWAHGIMTDITEQKKAEEEREKLQIQLIQAQKMESVGRLAGGVAHDFNNKLTVILGYTEMAMAQVAPGQPLHTDLGQILKAANHSKDITRQLLAFARKQTIAPEALDLNETVAGMLLMLQRLIGEDIDLVWLPGATPRPVKMDPSQIDQIMANLCVNARDAIAGVGKITIKTDNVTLDAASGMGQPDFYPGDFVLLAVSDDGSGMDQATSDNIFEPFFTTKAVNQGTGLGLATVYGIVKQNNGFINVHSTLGTGTTFKIYLPRYASAVDRINAESGPEISRGRGETVLLVEDEEAIMDMGRIMLEELGYRVVAANTPGDALRLATEHADGIHLLITDVVMPEMNGSDLADELHRLYPEIKTMFMSGYTADVIAHRGVLDDGVNFIQKPFTMKDLGLKIRATLGQK